MRQQWNFLVLTTILGFLVYFGNTKIIWGRHERIGHILLHVAIMSIMVDYFELKWGSIIVVVYMCVAVMAGSTLLSFIPRGGRLAVSASVTLVEAIIFWAMAQMLLMSNVARSRDSFLLQNLFIISVTYLNWHLIKSLSLIFSTYDEIKLHEFDEVHNKSDGYKRSSDITVAHLSDLHLSASRTLEGNVRSDDALRALRSAFDKVSRVNPDIVVVTGDVTDQGAGAEWDMFYDELALYNFRDKVVVVPGNHDININSLYYPSWKNRQFSLKCYNFIVKSLKRSTGGVVGGHAIELDTIMCSLDPFLRMYEECYNKANIFTLNQIEGMRKRVVEAFDNVGLEIEFADESVDGLFRAVLEGIFPIEYRFGDIKVLAVNSCTYKSVSIWDCGFGKIGEKQLVKLAAINWQAAYDQKIVYAMHHSPGLPKRSTDQAPIKRLFRKFENKSLALVDSGELLEVVGLKCHSILVHGHLHMSYHCTHNDTNILSAPSALYGDKKDVGNLMHVYNLDTFRSGVCIRNVTDNDTAENGKNISGGIHDK